MVSRTEAIRARIKQAREESGLTMKQMARAIGVAHDVTIARYESGVREPDWDTLERIAQATGQAPRVVLRRRLCRPGRRPRADLECRPEPAPASSTTVDTGADLAAAVAQVETEG